MKYTVSSLVLGILSFVLVVFGFHWIINTISVLFGSLAIVLAFSSKAKQKKWIIGLSVFGILGSAVWLLFNFV